MGMENYLSRIGRDLSKVAVVTGMSLASYLGLTGKTRAADIYIYPPSHPTMSWTFDDLKRIMDGIDTRPGPDGPYGENDPVAGDTIYLAVGEYENAEGGSLYFSIDGVNIRGPADPLITPRNQTAVLKGFTSAANPPKLMVITSSNNIISDLNVRHSDVAFSCEDTYGINGPVVLKRINASEDELGRINKIVENENQNVVSSVTSSAAYNGNNLLPTILVDLVYGSGLYIGFNFAQGQISAGSLTRWTAVANSDFKRLEGILNNPPTYSSSVADGQRIVLGTMVNVIITTSNGVTYPSYVLVGGGSNVTSAVPSLFLNGNPRRNGEQNVGLSPSEDCCNPQTTTCCYVGTLADIIGEGNFDTNIAFVSGASTLPKRPMWGTNAVGSQFVGYAYSQDPNTGVITISGISSLRGSAGPLHAPGDKDLNGMSDGALNHQDLQRFVIKYNEFPYTLTTISEYDFTGDSTLTESDVDQFIQYYTGPLTDCNTNGTYDQKEMILEQLVDTNGNGIPDDCPYPGVEIPAVNEWGLAVTALLIATGGTLVLRSRYTTLFTSC